MNGGEGERKRGGEQIDTELHQIGHFNSRPAVLKYCISQKFIELWRLEI